MKIVVVIYYNVGKYTSAEQAEELCRKISKEMKSDDVILYIVQVRDEATRIEVFQPNIINPEKSDLEVIKNMKSKAVREMKYTLAAHLREAEKELISRDSTTAPASCTIWSLKEN